MTAVDRTDTLEMLHSNGADIVIDYTEEDFTQRGEQYDLIVDIPGNHHFSACRWALTPQGKYVLVGHDNDDPSARRRLGSIPRFAGLAVRTPFSRNLPKLGLSAPSRQESLTELSALLAAGKLTPYIDRTYPLAEIHAAMRYLAAGQVRGKVVLTTAD